MKNKIMAMLVAFGLVGSVSAIEVNENLSISGFIDGSWSDTDASDNTPSNTDENELGLDEIEIDFLFNAGGVSAEVHVDSTGPNSLNIEQAYLSYGFEGGISLSVGQFNTNLGLEGEDAGGLYTYSRAYDSALDLGDVDSRGAQEGVRVGYSAENFSVSVSATNAVGAEEETAATPSVEDDLDIEVAIAFTGIENVSLGGGMRTSTDNAGAEVDVANLHATYTTGKLLIGAEYVSSDGGTAANDVDGWMLLADYDVSDVLGIAVRYSDQDVDATNSSDKLTIAPNYAITESLGAILEYSSANASANSGEEDTIALELTFTF
jgi:hypothetical protein